MNIVFIQVDVNIKGGFRDGPGILLGAVLCDYDFLLCCGGKGVVNMQ